MKNKYLLIIITTFVVNIWVYFVASQRIVSSRYTRLRSLDDVVRELGVMLGQCSEGTGKAWY